MGRGRHRKLVMALAYSSNGVVLTPTDASNPLAISFWAKSNSATGNMQFCSRHNSTSGSPDGFEIYTNSPGTNLVLVSKSGTTQIVGISGSGTFRDGNWHHIALNYRQTAGQTVELFLDGNLDASATPGSNHGGVSFPIRFGKGADTFFGAYNGDTAEMACWTSALTADQVTALWKGFRPPAVKRDGLLYYMPGVRVVQDFLGATLTTSGTVAASDHPRIY